MHGKLLVTSLLKRLVEVAALRHMSECFYAVAQIVTSPMRLFFGAIAERAKWRVFLRGTMKVSM